MKLYILKNRDGKYYKSRGYGGYGSRWVDNIEQARTYGKIGYAKAQARWWGEKYPQFGYPDIVVLEAKEIEVIKYEP